MRKSEMLIFTMKALGTDHICLCPVKKYFFIKHKPLISEALSVKNNSDKTTSKKTGA